MANFLDRIVHLPKMGKKAYNREVTELRYALVQAQNRIRNSKIPVMILFAGVDGAGKHEMVNLLSEWMDPRFLKTKAYLRHTEEELERPEMWRYWRDIPGEGEMHLFLSAWTTKPLMGRAKERTHQKEFNLQLEKINLFEKTLQDNGYLILKYWMHLDRDQQHERLVKLSSDERKSWQIKATDWENLSLYNRFVDAADEIIEATDPSSWTIVDGSVERSRSLVVAKDILASLDKRLKKAEKSKKPVTSKTSIGSAKNALGKVDLETSLTKEAYKKDLKFWQSRLGQLQRECHRQKISTVLVFEGWDAAGKGGAIRRITKALDSREYEILPVAAPTEEEIEHHYLWRFWKQIPSGGRLTIFDRSWYGRVLVERIEGFASEKAWHRAYEEINQFEEECVDHGMVLAKFWLHISKEEQLDRFKDREETPYKAWKLNDEDWRNRKQWNEYLKAAEDMFELTSTPRCPWTLIPANQKWTARIEVLKTVCRAMEKRLDQ
jgi:AMP-polyphosphate phosphotransferase